MNVFYCYERFLTDIIVGKIEWIFFIRRRDSVGVRMSFPFLKRSTICLEYYEKKQVLKSTITNDHSGFPIYPFVELHSSQVDGRISFSPFNGGT
jgi:hypothetical protein